MCCSLLSLPTFPLSCRLKRCNTDMNASISTMQLLMLLWLWDVEQKRQIFLYGLTLCRKITITLCRRTSASTIFSRLSLGFMFFQLIFLTTTIHGRTKTGEKKICTERRFKCSAIIYGDDILLMSSIYDTGWLSLFLWFHRNLHVATHVSVLCKAVSRISYRNDP